MSHQNVSFGTKFDLKFKDSKTSEKYIHFAVVLCEGLFSINAARFVMQEWTHHFRLSFSYSFFFNRFRNKSAKAHNLKFVSFMVSLITKFRCFVFILGQKMATLSHAAEHSRSVKQIIEAFTVHIFYLS